MRPNQKGLEDRMDLETVTTNPLEDLAREIIAEQAAGIESMRRGLEHFRRCGELLIQARERLDHGCWLPWLDKQCKMSRRTAQGYMQLASDWQILVSKADALRVAHLDALPLRQALTILAKPNPTIDEDRPLSKTGQELTAQFSAPVVWDADTPAQGARIQRSPIERAQEPDYRCPRCSHEWFGRPRRWHAGGGAMQDASLRKKNQRVLRVTSDSDQHSILVARLRALTAVT